jgi:hypothetical protein
MDPHYLAARPRTQIPFPHGEFPTWPPLTLRPRAPFGPRFAGVSACF